MIPELLKEVNEIREKLENYSPSQIIWDFEDLTKQPPWGNNISPDITSLANYFVTSSGDDLFEVLILALKDAIKLKSDFEIDSI